MSNEISLRPDRSGISAVAALLALLLQGCAAPSLEDAAVVEVKRATEDEFSRYLYRSSRASFESASVPDPEKGRIDFSKDEFDAFLTYLRRPDRKFLVVQGAVDPHSMLAPDARTGPVIIEGFVDGVLLLQIKDMAIPDWPILKFAFATRAKLVDPAGSGLVYGLTYLCNVENPREDNLGIGPLLWRGRVLTGQVAQKVEAVRSSSQEAQVYEAYVTYARTEEDPVPKEAKTVTLKGVSEDLCFSLFDSSVLAADGRPLRIERALVNEVLGPLPRTLELPGQEP